MDDAKQRFSLKRWSQRKHAARREPVAPTGDATTPPKAAPTAAAPVAATTTSSSPAPAATPLPPVESLTFEADFSAFMKPDVEPSLKNAALKKLFADPRFNVMDGLDVYIDDYSKPDPIDAETVAKLVQSRYLFDPPKTRVNERGEVEDVPVDEAPVPATAAEAPVDAAAPVRLDDPALAPPGSATDAPGAAEPPADAMPATSGEGRKAQR